MKRVDVVLGERTYPVVIGEGLLDQAEEAVRGVVPGGRLFVVSDSNVWAALGPRLRIGEPILVPPGEASKSWARLQMLTEQLIAAGIERGDHVVAFGGGMIGDLAGFAAAIVKRGCGLIQIPTSLLAQVDSSVGGKTGINAATGKNMIGAFHQPAAVLIDPAALDTLPERELRAGYAEIVKYGLIGDADFFTWCEANGAALLAGDVAARLHAIGFCVETKARIVAADERETRGQRALLNLGHTFGHALEAATGFSDRLLHGEAVALGTALAFRFSAERGLGPPADAERVEAHLHSVGLPTRLSDIEIDPSGSDLVAHMKRDKKASGGRVPFILARGIGRAFVDATVDLAEVASFLDRERQPG